MNRSVSSDRVSSKGASRGRGFMLDDRAKYPSYVQVLLGLLVLGIIFGASKTRNGKCRLGTEMRS